MTRGKHRSSEQPAARPAQAARRVPAARPAVPDSGLWYSDREIGYPDRSQPIAYSTEDFRRELARVERKMSIITAACILIGIAAVVVIVWVVLNLLGIKPF